MFTGKTHVYGIVGQPVAHSLSPVFQNYFFQQMDEDAVYVPFPVAESTLETALTGLRHAGVRGLNITVPFKETVVPWVSCDAAVQVIGAANTLKVTDEGWHAWNTDWQGVQAVLQATGLRWQNEALLLFGAGGTARAVLHAAAALGVAQVWVCNRSEERCRHLLKHAQQQYPDMQVLALPWCAADVMDACGRCAMLVNTTTIGLSEGQDFPFVLSGTGWAMDAVYRPDGVTALTRAVQASSERQVVDGLPMLVAQGAASFHLWYPQYQPRWQDALAYMEDSLYRQHRCPWVQEDGDEA